jgi:membrane protease subunit HflK
MVPDRRIQSQLVRTVDCCSFPDVLRLQREPTTEAERPEGLSAAVRRAAQQRLDRLQCGMIISAMEFKQLQPPRHVIAAFRDVQSAQIDVETQKREAEGFAAREVPQAQAERNSLIQTAAANQNALHGRATEEYSVFEKLHGEYRKNPDLVRNRIYLETLEQVLSTVGKVDLVSPDDRVILDE